MAKPDKRDDIIRAAMTLIAEQGFHGAPMAMIAEKAGVGTGTIYRYFTSRDTLINDLYREEDKRFVAFLLEKYQYDRPVRECFFHIGIGIIKYFIRNSLEFRYIEQFHNSPYGVEYRRNRLFESADKPDIFTELYERGLAQQVIKNLPQVIFFNLAFAPIIWVLRDHLLRLVDLDDSLSEKLVSACWDSVKM